jgi:hypothetical protein
LAAFSFAAFSSGVSPRESNKAVDITVFVGGGGDFVAHGGAIYDLRFLIYDLACWPLRNHKS